MIYEDFPSPCYVLEEDKLRRNLAFIRRVAEEAGVEVILALKAFAQWRTFPIFREYIRHTTASSPYEARLSAEAFGGLTYTYSPAYERSTFDDILRYSEHITFNSLTQHERFYPYIKEWEQRGGHRISVGLRINPEYSDITTELYNPCAPGSRFGLLSMDLPSQLPEGVEGLHFHCLCENDADSLQRVLSEVERRFSPWLDQVKWVNMGGGHLMTREGYHTELLIGELRAFRERHPGVSVILEPGSAFLWQTGFLVATVVDVVENHGIRTALLNVSFACHMPDCLEMPYQPEVVGAEIVDASRAREELVYRLGGNSCLSGDYVGCWKFPEPLQVGQRVVLQDMIHYTTVKTHMFNGVDHPQMALLQQDGQLRVLRKFCYEDYRDRMN